MKSSRAIAAAIVMGFAMSRPMIGQAADKLTIGVVRTASAGPHFIAQDRGMFGREGLEVEIKIFDASQPVAVAVVSGDLDIGAAGFTAGFFNLAGKGGLRIFAGTTREEPGYRLVAYVASIKAYEDGLRGVRDLAAKSVGTTSAGSPTYYAIGLLARKYGFDYGAVRLVPLQSFANMVAALKGGQVDAILPPASIAAQLEERGEGRVIGWVGDETPWQLGALFASTRSVQERRPIVERFLRAYLEAAAAYHAAFLARDDGGKPSPGANHDELLAIIGKHLGQSPAQIRNSIAFVDPAGRLKIGDVHRQVEFWRGLGLVDPDVDPRRFIDPSFVAEHLDVPK